MNPSDNYKPCFALIPDDWKGRWELLREFVRRWHRIPLGPVGITSPVVEQEETRLGVTLSPSLREWISFAQELIARQSFDILRDCYEVTRLEDHAAISLMLQGEADVYWAVNEMDLSQDDPPVTVYTLDYDAQEADRFVPDGNTFPHITGFLLEHLAYYLHGKGGGALVEVFADEAFLTEMRQAFPIYARFDHLHVFEAENIFALVFPASDAPQEGTLLVEVWKPIPRYHIPACIFANLNRGGAFHGMLVPERHQA